MKLNRFLLVVIAIAIPIALNAQQTGWLVDLKLAKTVAQATNKLILVDFYASWCGPCKKMDAEVWSTEEASAIKKNFIPVKINFDIEKDLITKYNIQSIPRLILMDYKGEVLHTKVGYYGKRDILDFISRIPSDATVLYDKMPEDDSNETFEQTKGLGLAMQELSQQTTYSPLQSSFLSLSNRWFKHSTKLAEDANKVNEIELLTIINDIHRDKTKQVIKEIDENRTKYENTPNESLMYYVLLQAYKKSGDHAAYEYALSKLREKEDGKKYLSLLK